MLKTLVEVTGDTPRYANCAPHRVENDKAGVFSSVETLLDF